LRERLLLFGAPNTGKTRQLVSIAKYAGEVLKKKVAIIDLEDKLEPMLLGMDIAKVPWLKYWVAVEENETSQWEVYKKCLGEVSTFLKPDDWLMVDRIDLSWPAVQRWYTLEVKKQSLADTLLDKAQSMKKVAMFVPPMEKGAWQVINEEYESAISKILYGLRCNVVLTAGIKSGEDTPTDVFGGLGVLPRGQKELPHQPHTAILLVQRRNGKDIQWYYTTAKDIPLRKYVENEPLMDFGMQYISEYVNG